MKKVIRFSGVLSGALLVSGLFANPVLTLDRSRYLDPGLAEICAIHRPESITLGASASGPSIYDRIISELFPYQVGKKLIEKTEGDISGPLPTPYSGPYLTKVFIIKQVWPSGYPYGVYDNIAITHYSDSGAVEIYTQGLNYHGSAEMADHRACWFMPYTQSKDDSRRVSLKL